MSLTITISKKDSPQNPIYQSNGVSWLQDIMANEAPNGNYWEASFNFTASNLKNIKEKIAQINQESSAMLEALEEVEKMGAENFKYWGGTA